jgi:hypothetical protein
MSTRQQLIERGSEIYYAVRDWEAATDPSEKAARLADLKHLRLKYKLYMTFKSAAEPPLTPADIQAFTAQ